jgi:hypothetical protein
MTEAIVDLVAREKATKAGSDLEKHEAVCAQRWTAVDLRLKYGSEQMQHQRYILYAIVLLLMLGEGSVLAIAKRVFLNQ